MSYGDTHYLKIFSYGENALATKWVTEGGCSLFLWIPSEEWRRYGVYGDYSDSSLYSILVCGRHKHVEDLLIMAGVKAPISRLGGDHVRFQAEMNMKNTRRFVTRLMPDENFPKIVRDLRRSRRKALKRSQVKP